MSCLTITINRFKDILTKKKKLSGRDILNPSKNVKSNEVELLPRPGSPLYNLNHKDEAIRKKTLRKWRIANKYLVLPLYQREE